MKLVYLGRYNTSEYLSGPEKVAKRIFENVCVKNKNSIFLDYFFKNREDSTLFNRLLGKKNIQKNPSVLRLGIIRLCFYLLKNQPEVIHLVTAERFMVIIFLNKLLLKAKIVTTIHGLLKYELKNYRGKRNYYSRFKDYLAEYLIIKFSDKLFFLSQLQLKKAKEYYNLNKKSRITIIPNGVDNIFINKNKKSKPTNIINFVFYNGYELELKGFEILNKTLLSMKLDRKIKLFILGKFSGIKKNDFIEYITVPKLNTLELREFLLDKDVYINPSIFDSFSLMAFECMSMGLVTIVSSNTGVSSLIKNNYNGFVFSDEIELAEILSLIISNKLNLNQIYKNAIDTVKNFTWEKITYKYIVNYKELINEI